MSQDRIKSFLGKQPFEPFTVQTGDGSTVDVLSREFAWLHPGNRTLVVSVPVKRNAREEGEFEDHHIDIFLVAKVIVPPKRSQGRRVSK